MRLALKSIFVYPLPPQQLYFAKRHLNLAHLKPNSWFLKPPSLTFPRFLISLNCSSGCSGPKFWSQAQLCHLTSCIHCMRKCLGLFLPSSLPTPWVIVSSPARTVAQGWPRCAHTWHPCCQLQCVPFRNKPYLNAPLLTTYIGFASLLEENHRFCQSVRVHLIRGACSPFAKPIPVTPASPDARALQACACHGNFW